MGGKEKPYVSADYLEKIRAQTDSQAYYDEIRREEIQAREKIGDSDRLPCWGYLLDETPNAFLVSKTPRAEVGRASFGQWFPRSQLAEIKQKLVANAQTEIHFNAPGWLIKKKQLWDFVK